MSRWLRRNHLFPRLSALAALCAPACAHVQPSSGGSAAPEKRPSNLSGVWDWILSSTDDDNNKRIEQEEWHLEQRGDVIDGFYYRLVTVISGDDNLFRCNGQRKFQKRMQFRVQGQVRGQEVVLRESGVDVEPGPCGTPVRELQSYIGRTSGQSLTLTWDAELPSGLHQRGQQVLFRRPLEQAAARIEPLQRAAEPPALQVSGIWTWEMRGLGWDGDTKVEQEEWHLQQAGAAIHGYYDRIVTSISSDGHPYRCNQQTQFATVTRYQVEGSVSGYDIQIRETSFDAKPSPCEERPQRRLDAYRGSVAPEEIRLSWGTGQQVLRRNRAQVPTSSF
jgi:hypothetical protein